MSVEGLAVKGLVDVEGAEEAGLDAEALRRAFDLLASWVEADVLPGRRRSSRGGARSPGRPTWGWRTAPSSAPDGEPSVRRPSGRWRL